MPINAHIVPSRIAAIALPRSMTSRIASAGCERVRRNRRRVLADAVPRNGDHVEVIGQGCCAARIRRTGAPAARCRWDGDGRRHPRAPREDRARTASAAASISRAIGRSVNPSAMPAAWLPCPGKQSATRANRTGWLLGDNHFAAVIVAAVRADPVRDSRLAAARARRQRGHFQGVVGAPKVATAL